MRFFDPNNGQTSARVLVLLAIAIVTSGLLALPQGMASESPHRSPASAGEVRVLLVGSYAGGPTHWVTQEAFLIENVLEFNGIPYDFFDIKLEVLTQAVLDSYRGVILDGYSIRYYTTEAERQLIAGNMEAGDIVALVGLICGLFSDLNGTIYSAVDARVDSLGNEEANIILLEGATKVYDYVGEGGFVFVGGFDAKHVGMTISSLGTWTMSSGAGDKTGNRQYGLELALEMWMENAFGVDVRVAMPTISLRLDDTQTTNQEQHPEVLDFIDANRHRIRASGFLVTDGSAYQYSDTTLQHYEQIISKWGTMSLHGKDHGTVGADGEDRDYATQYSDMSEAVAFLAEHFPRYNPVKASPNNSWNEATLHAMYDTGIYYHTACYWKSDEYKTLYESLFDVSTEMERQKMKLRAKGAQLVYYPLKHSDETGVAEIYSIDWGPVVSGADAVYMILPLLKSRALDWWVPLCIGSHYFLPGLGGANNSPLGWMQVMEELMEIVDGDTYCWRRWVDMHDFGKNLQRFDSGLSVNGITVSGNMINYDLTAAAPIRYMTLKAHRAGHTIASVSVNGEAYAYFGDDYVHLPAITGNAVVCVTLTSAGDGGPHITHIDPSAVIENAGCTDEKLHLTLSGEFPVTAHVAGSSRAFAQGLTHVYSNTTLDLEIDASSLNEADQVDLSMVPSSGTVDVSVAVWDTCGGGYRRWTESASGAGIAVDHSAGYLVSGSPYVVRADGALVDTCVADADGCICFTTLSADSTQMFEILCAAQAGIEGRGSDSGSFPHDISDTPCRIEAVSPIPLRGAGFIRYRTSGPRPVMLSIHSVGGRHVVTLIDEAKPGGSHLVRWNGCDSNGFPVAPGVYFCRLKTDGHVDVKKILVVR